MEEKVATHSLSPWRPGDEKELFYNEIAAMVVNPEQTVDLKGQDLPDDTFRKALSSLYSTKFCDHVTHFSFEDGANPILDIFVHTMLKWESDKRRLVPLLLVSWRDLRRTADLIQSGQMSESRFVEDEKSASMSLSLDAVERFCQVLSANQQRLASVKKHPLKQSRRFTKDWEPSFLVPIYPNGIPTTGNMHLTIKLRAAARDEAHFNRLALEHSSCLLYSRLGIVTRRFFIRKSSTRETQMLDQLGSPTDKLLCDSEGRAYVFEDRGEAAAFALSMDCVDVRGLGDESWDQFRRNVPHVFIKKGSRPALPDAGASHRTKASKGTTGKTALADARALKDRGNAHLQAGDLAKAVDCYAAGVSALEELLSVAATPSETQACESLLLVMASNKAQAHLQAGECSSARDAAERALRLDPSHSKSIVRRVRALCDLGALDDATSAIEKALVLDISKDARKALEQISARLVARSQPLPKPVGKFLSVDDFMSRDDLLGAILRGLASSTSFITESIDRREVQAHIARDVGSVAADLLRVVLAMQEGHDKQSDLPLSLLNASEVIQMLDKVLNRDHLPPIDKAHTLYLRGVAQMNIREWGAAAEDFEEAYRLSKGQEVWLLVWCARANVEDLVPPRPCQATHDEQMQYRQRGYARAVQNYGMLISALEQSLNEDPEIEGMLVFAFWELAYAKQCALFARQPLHKASTIEGSELLRHEWLELVLPTALRAQEAEAKCVYEIVNCIQKDFVSQWMARFTTGTGEALLPPGRPVEVTGLQSRADLNGKRGTVGHFDPVSKRYEVSFTDHAPVSIRLINLKLVASSAQSQPQEAPTQGEHPVGSPPPQELERGPSLSQEGESDSIVLEGLDALRSMQEAGKEKEKRKVEIQEAMQRGDLPDPALFGVAQLHSMMQEERQAINQQRELYEARAQEQKKAADSLQIQAQSLASLKEQWRIKAAELEQEKGDALRWANEEAARQESVLQSRIEQLESEKDQETSSLRNGMAALTKELQRMTQTLEQVEKDFQGKLQTAKAEHTQAQEALEIVLAEREEFQCHIARRRREAKTEWQRIRVLQGSIEEAEAELQAQRLQIQEGEKRLCRRELEVEEQRRKLHEVKNSLGFNVGSPEHWSQLADPQQLHVDRITDEHLLGLLQQALVCQNPNEWLGQGADVRERGESYNHIGLCEAWRVQHLSIWHKYCAEVSKMQSELASNGLTAPDIAIRDDLQTVSRQLPGPALNGRVHETFLLHGTTLQTVLSLLQDGFNERFNRRANFGHGSYLAEDAGKCDQYLARDESYNPTEPLHNLLFGTPHSASSGWKARHPRNVYWILLARACLGYAAVSVDGNIESRGGQVWDQAGAAPSRARTHKRELAKIAGHQMRFHSLVVETSDPALSATFHHSRVYRYREFVFPHGDRIYPEYLLAVRREHR